MSIAASSANHPGESLDGEVDQYVRRGWRVESRTSTQAVMVKGRRPNHLLHLILTLLTLGLWAVVWILVAAFGGEKRMVITL